jgi:alpha-maltose-1-phosphate synthase
VPPSFAHAPERTSLEARTGATFVACPDARAPAYQAVVGLARANQLSRFLTAFYHRDDGPASRIGRRLAPVGFARLERTLLRRHDSDIPSNRVSTVPSFDVALAVENRVGRSHSPTRHRVARWRTRRFDRILARALERELPESLLVFSDVGSELSLPACRELGIRSVLSMVHGDVREERAVLAAEAERSPDFFPIYLSDGPVNRAELDWLHERRLRDIALADRILVPSEHIAGVLEKEGTARDRIRVTPYAADTRRFRPAPDKRHDKSCVFLFAGGINQRKGVKYLLEAWRRVRRPGWRLQLLGPLPSDASPLEPYLNEVELLGRVSHAEMPNRMAAADVFVFPSLFEGSAVVTYEALACGLPSIVTPTAGSVVRNDVEGFLIPPADVDRLAERMESLGVDIEARAVMSLASRQRAEEFDWPRYHASIVNAVSESEWGSR